MHYHLSLYSLILLVWLLVGCGNRTLTQVAPSATPTNMLATPATPVRTTRLNTQPLQKINHISTTVDLPSTRPTPWPTFTPWTTSTPCPMHTCSTSPPKPVLEASLTPTTLPTPISVTRLTTKTVTPPTLHGKALVVDQTTQALYVYEDGQEIRALPVSTGKRQSYTPAFEGRIDRYTKTLYGYGTLSDHAWYLAEATGAIYLHGAPYTQINGKKAYQDLEAIGIRPSSHGCIRLHPLDAAWLARWDPRDTPIIITRPDFERFSN